MGKPIAFVFGDFGQDFQLVPDLKRNTCSVCLLRLMLAMDLSHMAFIILKYVLFSPTLLVDLITNG